MSITEQLVNSVCTISKNLSDGQATFRFVWNPKVCIKFTRTHHWLYLEPQESSRQAHTRYFIKSTLILSSLLRSSAQSSLFYPQFFIYKKPLYIRLLPERAICSAYFNLLDTLMFTVCGKN